ncbi:hypothetical protein BE20_00810 [Sorangium cellulosum]|uniref:Uncharacterized protein n=1 Tax=Sorangium cellulosum TaxID=56 RepID=A0A150RKT0_SORCE|nr:hypothetical protein BE18_18640 [Sorangium cellulosum]KYF94229.1 hypothetical protein BE20_00810 [Sorangium cellulosum]
MTSLRWLRTYALLDHAIPRLNAIPDIVAVTIGRIPTHLQIGFIAVTKPIAISIAVTFTRITRGITIHVFLT